VKQPARSVAGNEFWESNLAYPGSLQAMSVVAAAGKYVYVGLSFGSAIGNEPIDGRIARWDGERWISLGDKLTSTPSALYAVGEELYVAGSFESIAGKNIAGVAKWSNVTGQWTAIGTGVGPITNPGVTDSPEANDIVVVNGVVYIAGEFERVDGVEIYNVAKFENGTWSAVGNGFYHDPTGSFGRVDALDVTSDGRVIVGGKFTHFYVNPTGNTIAPANFVAQYDPATGKFAAMGAGLSAPPGGSLTNNAQIGDVLAVGNDIYVAGAFERAGGVLVNGIAKWNGSAWSALGSGLGNGSIAALAHQDGVLLAGGLFGTIGSVNAHRIARWKGNTWTGLDQTNSSEDDVNGIAAAANGVFYVVGDFETLGGLRGNNIVRWYERETRWRTVGEGLGDGVLPGNVTAMHVLPDGNVIVAGDFTEAGGKPVQNMALWNPERREWMAFASTDGAVYTIVRIGDLLYFGGGFQQIGGITAGYIATYNPATSEWRSIGALNNSVFAIAPAHDGLIYVGGRFDGSPNGRTHRFALFNPTNGQWSPAPFEFDSESDFYKPQVFTLLPDADGVLIAGSFFRLSISGQLTRDRFNSLVYWNRKTNSLTRFGDGARNDNDTLGTIQDIVPIRNGDLYFGGRFKLIGTGIAANNMARLNNAGWQPLGQGVTSSGSETPQVRDLQLVGSCLFVGGDFQRAGNTGSSDAAIWRLDRNDWEALGDGIAGGSLDKEVVAMTLGGTQVYFGGEFYFAGDGQSGSFAVWNLALRSPLQPPVINPALAPRALLLLTIGAAIPTGGQCGGA
jgi:hypothetical protein